MSQDTDRAVDVADADREKPVEYRDVPDWDDEYLDRVSDRLMFNYDLEKDYRVRGETFPLYGTLRMESQKQFFHPALSYGRHESSEYLFVRRTNRTSVAELERLVTLGHDLAADIEADEEHFSTDFTFALVVADLDDKVRKFVTGFHDRTLLKYGYYGHYEVNLLVVAPEREELVASPNADVGEAFRFWEPTERKRRGVFSRVAGLFRS
ncbi:MAG TPA: hypothetical protein VFJ06_11360 [Halococcus sp.]|nr:hypothetical protein [Halococcus sp.]